MKLKVYVIDAELSRGARRAIRMVTVGLATLLGLGAVVYAAPPRSFTTGETLTAADLNGNFSDLDARMAVLEASPRPPTAFKRVRFDRTLVPILGAGTVTLATLTFTSPVTGTAVLRGRGDCRTVGTSQDKIHVYAGTTVADALTNSEGEQGVVKTGIQGATLFDFESGFTSETSRVVTAGVPETVVLVANREVGTDVGDYCVGSFSVEVYTGVLP